MSAARRWLWRCSHRSSLALANEHGLRTIAFPAISCGVYGYPAEEAAEIALTTCAEHAEKLEEIRFVLFGDAMYRTWCEVARRVLKK